MNAQQLRNSILQEAIEGRLVPPACRQAGKTLTMNPQTYIKGQSCWFTYVIECEDGSFYKGFTDNLLRRYKQHCDGIGAEHTKRHKPKQLYYWEMHYSQEEALAREKYLKSGSGREWFQREVVEKADNWEPASVLLAKIRKEKERLVKEGKLKKKELEVKPISEDEIPFEIPESWEWVRLGRITDVKGGKRIPVGYKWQDTPTSHIYIRVSDMKDGTISSSDLKYLNDEIYNQIKQYTINKEDLYLTIVGSTIGKAGFVPSVFDGMNLTENAVKLSSISIYKEYLYYLIISPFAQSQFVDKTKQVGQPKLAINRILSSLLPIPPIAEQHRIVAKIEELLPKVEKYGKAQDALNKLNAELPERLKKSILQEAIEGRLVPQDPNDEPASVLLQKIREEKQQLVKADKLKKKDLIETPISDDEIPFAIPDTWEWVRINTIMNILDAQRKPVSKSDRVAGLYPYCGANGILDYVKHYIFDGSFVLVGEDGSVMTKAGNPVVNRIEGKIWVNNHAHVLQEYGSLGYQDYIFYCLQGTDITKYVHGFMPKYSQSDLRDTLIPLPPIEEQHRIVEKIEHLLGEIDKLKK